VATPQDVAAKILFAETSDFNPDPANPAAIQQLRRTLAVLILDSDNGIGFAAPREPTVANLGNPDLLAAWQSCNAAVSTPATLPDPAAGNHYAVILSNNDPRQVSSLLDAYEWIAATTPVASGNGLRGALSITAYLVQVAGDVPAGRYPRSDAHPVVTPASATLAAAKRVIGGICTAVAILLLIASAYWAATRPGLGTRVVEAAGAAAQTDLQNAIDAAKDAQADSGNVEKAEKAADASNALSAEIAKAKGKAGTDPAVLAGMPTLMPCGILAIASVLGMILAIGYGLRGNIIGGLVDDRGRLSLSRFQLAMWTVVILGGYWTLSFWNIAIGPPGTIVLPALQQDLWLLLGVVTISPLASSLVLSVRRQQTVDPPGTTVAGGQTGTATPPGVPQQAVGQDGPLDIRTQPNTWSFLDLFTGEEVANRGSIDLTRVQNFVFTLIALGAYLTLLLQQFKSVVPGAAVAALPPLSASLVGLLAISHAAYLAAKSLPKG
jgi:hypothetical protein